MTRPSSYREQQKSKSYKELLKEREKLLKEIKEFENIFDKQIEDNSIIMDPSPEVIHQCNLQYLSKLCDLIAKKYSHKYMGIR